MTRVWPAARVALGTAALAAALAAAAHAWGPPGGDEAAHLYLTAFWRAHGWLAWDNLWYSGRYALVNYSLAYHPLAALAGPVAVSAASAGAGAWAFAVLVRRRWPQAGPWPALAFALLAPLPVVAGTYPFALGLAGALWALVAMDAGRAWPAVAGAAAATAASPLALVFLLLAAAAAALARPARVQTRAGAVVAGGLGALLAAQLASMRAFPAPSARYPFDPKDAAAIVAFCAAGLAMTWRAPAARDLRAFFAVYLAATLGSLAVPSGVGGNMVRVTLVAGLPLMLAAAAFAGRRAMPLAAAACAAALAWQLIPAWTGGRAALAARAPDAAFWAPVEAYWAAHGDPGHRAHVVATGDNWEARFVSRRGIPLTRGWFRQDDFPVNAPLYDDPLTPAAYVAWLRDVAAEYVFLPDDALDYTGAREARVLAAGALPVAARLPGWTVYAVPGAVPIATPSPAATVVSVTSAHVVVRVAAAGEYRLRMRWSPYLTAGPGACVSPRAPWGVALSVSRPGTVDVAFDPTPGRVWDVLSGRDTRCPPRL